MAQDQVKTYGLPIDIDPFEALLQEIRRSAGHVAWLEEKVASLQEHELKQLDMSGKFERPCVWLEMLWKERRQLSSVAADAVRCGIEERMVKVAEVQAAAVVTAIVAVLTDPELGLDAERLDYAKRLAAAKLREISAA